MALSIKNPEVERLAAEVARLAGETKTEAVRQALIERRLRLTEYGCRASRKERIMRFLDEKVRPLIPPERLGKPPSKEEREEILGYGPEGY